MIEAVSLCAFALFGIATLRVAEFISSAVSLPARAISFVCLFAFALAAGAALLLFLLAMADHFRELPR